MVKVPDELPATVKQSFYDNLETPILWPTVVKAAINEGVRDVDAVTDIIFYTHHPELIGSALSEKQSNYDALSGEWLAWRGVARSSIAGLSGGGKTKPLPRPAARPEKTPQALTAQETIQLKPGGFISWSDAPSPNGIAVAKSGDIWHMPEGKRLIIRGHQWWTGSGDSLKEDGIVWYQQLSSDQAMYKVGTVYRQSREGFLIDFAYSGLAIAGKKLASTQVIIEAEMNVLLGIACANPIILAAEKGLSATEWILENKKNFGKWTAAVALVLEARRELKKHCPTLWDKIVDATLLGAWKGTKAAVAMFGVDVAGNIPESFLSDEKKVGKATGTLVGKFGAGNFAGRMGALRVVWTVLSFVAVQAAAAVPGAVKITAAEKKKAALDMIQALRRAGVALSEGDAETIVEEVVANAATVRGALEKLRKGFEAFKSE